MASSSHLALGFAFTALVPDFNWVFILAVMILGLALFMLLGKIFAAQILLILALSAREEIGNGLLFYGFIALQVLLAVWLVIRLYIEIEWSHTRRLEKNLKLPRVITRNGNAGIKDYRF